MRAMPLPRQLRKIRTTKGPPAGYFRRAAFLYALHSDAGVISAVFAGGRKLSPSAAEAIACPARVRYRGHGRTEIRSGFPMPDQAERGLGGNFASMHGLHTGNAEEGLSKGTWSFKSLWRKNDMDLPFHAPSAEAEKFCRTFRPMPGGSASSEQSAMDQRNARIIPPLLWLCKRSGTFSDRPPCRRAVLAAPGD